MRVVLFDGTEATQNVIFTVVTSPRRGAGAHVGPYAGAWWKRAISTNARCWRRGRAGYRFPNLRIANTGRRCSVTAATNQCGTGGAGAATYWIRCIRPIPVTRWKRPRLADAEATAISRRILMVPPPRTSAATGADGMFSGAEPNYLSCSGNELVMTRWTFTH